MRYCVIGIHSDRVVMEIREQCDSGFISLLQEKETVLLENYLSPHGLTVEGQELLFEALEQLLSYGQKLICDDIFCFATSILRYASNSQDILCKMEKQLDLKVKILSGAQQAQLCCQEIGKAVGQNAGIGCQIGGGSTQIFLFSGGVMQEFASLPIGHAMLYNRYVSSILPNSVEAQLMRQAISDAVQSCPFRLEQHHRTIYMMGECCENVAKLHLSTGGNLTADILDGLKRQTTGRPIALDDYILIAELLRNRNLNGAALLNRMFPDCTTTVFPAMIMMQTIGTLFGTEEHIIVRGSLEHAYFTDQLTQVQQVSH